MWRKPVPIRRVTLTAELTLASVYFTRKKLILLPEPKGKAHAPVVQNRNGACSDYLDWVDPKSWPSWTSQSVDMEKRWSGKQGRVIPWVSSAVEWLFVALTCPQLSLGLLFKRRAIKGRRARNGREGRGDSLPFVFLVPNTPRAPFGHASRVLRV